MEKSPVPIKQWALPKIASRKQCTVFSIFYQFFNFYFFDHLRATHAYPKGVPKNCKIPPHATFTFFVAAWGGPKQLDFGVFFGVGRTVMFLSCGIGNPGLGKTGFFRFLGPIFAHVYEAEGTLYGAFFDPFFPIRGSRRQSMLRIGAGLFRFSFFPIRGSLNFVIFLACPVLSAAPPYREKSTVMYFW